MLKKPKLWLAFVLLLLVISSTATWLLLDKQEGNPGGAVEVTKPLNAPQLNLVPITSGLENATVITSTNGKADDRLFVAELKGTLRVIDRDRKLQEQPFLDISSKVLAKGEMGLLGLAFHPKYSDNGYFYVNYVNRQQETIIARYQAKDNQADLGSEKVLIRIKQPFENHNGGELQFGPDGYLYVALGDGGSGGDPDDRSQNKDTLLGKLLRIDVDRGEPYGIPPTNPFLGQSGTKAEIWAYGLRNPWRFSFDKQTGDLLIADVGQNATEEVNFQAQSSRGGENYGWRCFEGNSNFNLSNCSDRTNYVFPVFEYNHDDDRCSITGGYVYRGSRYPALVGKYLYGDFCNGQIFFAEQASGWQPSLALDSELMISTFGQDRDGEIYLADFGSGSIYHVQDSAN